MLLMVREIRGEKFMLNINYDAFSLLWAVLFSLTVGRDWISTISFFFLSFFQPRQSLFFFLKGFGPYLDRFLKYRFWKSDLYASIDTMCEKNGLKRSHCIRCAQYLWVNPG